MSSGILDANGAIGLAKGGVFHHLPALYAPLYVPTAVREEVVDQGAGRPGAAELAAALGSWITEVTPDAASLAAVAVLPDLADRQVLAVAKARSVDHALTEDDTLRRELRALGVTCLRGPEVVMLMKTQGCIAAVKPVLDRMRSLGHGIPELHYRAAVLAAAETP
jgi:predicted nucleic acid-binding protein